MPNTAAPSATAGIPSAGVGSLSTLLRRLEAATSRLEDIAMTQAPSGGPHFVSGASAVQPGSSGVTAAGAGAAAAAGAGAGAAVVSAAHDEPPAVKDYDELLEGPLAKYASLSQELGGLIAEQAQHTLATFKAQREFVKLAAACKKPAASAFEPLIKPTQQPLMAAIEMKEKNRASKESNQLTVVAEGIPALGWVMLDSKPGPYVGEHKDSADFWVNRVVKEHKESNPKQVEWARSFSATLEALRKYIMQHHTTGLSWNANGIATDAYSAATPSSSASTAGGPPPPPPPPPPPAPPAAPPAPPAPSASSAPAAAASGDMSGVFAALNQGENVTRGLKKVDKSEMTHKNPELRGSGVVPSTSPQLGKGPAKPPKPQSFQKKPPKTALEGKVWNIENHENNAQIVIDQTELNQVVNVYNVKSSVIQVKGKVNAISLVNCAKVSLLMDSAVASLAISASPSFTVQVLGKVPTILVDGTDGGQIYLSRESLDAEIITAKTSAINVSLPVEGEEDGIFEEKAVPEQLKTVVVNGKLVTTIVEHSG